MQTAIKTQDEILSKLQIEKLNPMQEAAGIAIESHPEIVLLSPTGTGKTLAFLLPVIKQLDSSIEEVQVLILVPSRELAIQIEQVFREMGTGFKANAVYGGRHMSKDKMDLKHRPAVLIGTPGRIADHMRRETFPTEMIKTLILDEFDKSLEVGFESEMTEIVESIEGIEKKILTSATNEIEIPKFINVQKPQLVDFLSEGISQLEVVTILSEGKDKLAALVESLKALGQQPGIVFCNFKDSIERISDYLNANHIPHGVFYGGMEQKDRERALIKFRNGSYHLLLATDLAARGIDIPELKFIIHYHLPNTATEFTHRNGRTARMNSEGSAYVIQWEKEELPDFIQALDTNQVRPYELSNKAKGKSEAFHTLFISGGRKDKISKGDIVGLFLKQGKLEAKDLGTIEIKQDCAFVAVKASQSKAMIELLNNTKLKNKKVKITMA
ncbi:MAG: helicase [Cytophagales bacterium CG12_big_fil_rev_8_21_14_0_65_40_12]|nr:MAG: helicase [Cytophagales bacterium CG12_big_fil_rev_8_21_14_0_65_40_12]PIW05219.1 MAG: helicase [Cytophagales bacterium CG17_big_fil_post_rev_8_21_14_2_50_40_13]